MMFLYTFDNIVDNIVDIEYDNIQIQYLNNSINSILK